MFEAIHHFDHCREAHGQQARVEDTRIAAKGFRQHMLDGPKVRYFESFDLVKVPYPVRYGLRNAFAYERLIEYMHIQNRLFVIQFNTPDGLKTLLASPSDHERNGETPFFRRLQDRTPKSISTSPWFRKLPLPARLPAIRVSPTCFHRRK